MSQQTTLTLVPSAIAVIVAVAVPWFTFRLALTQDGLRRLHDQRAQLYVDLLTEAFAEQKYFDYDIADDETRARMLPHFHDLRLPPLERARQGSQANIFASAAVIRLLNVLLGQALGATLIGRPKNEAERLMARLRVGEAVDALQAQVRREMGTDKIEPKP